MTLIEKLLANNVNPWGGFQDSPGKKNDNPNLFLVTALWEIHLAGEDVKQGLVEWDKYMAATYKGKGRFVRFPDRYMLSSHDEHTGMAAGCLLYRKVHGKPSRWAPKLLSLGKRAWNYSSAKEAMPPWNLLKGQLKPNDVAFIKLCCGVKSGPIGRRSILLNAQKSDSYNLHRLRGVCIQAMNTKDKVLAQALLTLKNKTHYVKAITKYYGPTSIITEAATLNNACWRRV